MPGKDEEAVELEDAVEAAAAADEQTAAMQLAEKIGGILI
jgi:hypothetical protein